jgi:hypothetical protein
MKKLFLLFGAVALACTMQAKTLTLDVAHPLNPATPVYDANGVWDGVYNEDDYATIDFQGMSFFHEAMADWDFWYGFSLASCTDTAYTGMTDQFRCVAGGGLAGKGTPYIIAYAMEGMGPVSPCDVYFTTDNDPWQAEEIYFCNEAWALHNVTVGGAGHIFAAGDSLVVIIEGLDASGEAIEGKQVTFFLADYRSANEADWTLNKGWEKCDLTALGQVYGLRFTMKTSDVGDWGSNTALYFALDGLKISRPEVVAGFEDITLAKADTVWQGADAPVLGWNNWTSGTYNFQTYYDNGYGSDYYSAFTVSNQTANTFEGLQDAYHSASGGAYEGNNFVVWNMNYYGSDTVTFEPQVVPGFWINNTAYAVNSMVNGDSFAKAFGHNDWFKLTIDGYLNGMGIDTQVEVYLAKDGKYINQWTYVDLTQFGEMDAITFTMSSSDTGDWGMNTPAYFAMDNFGAAMPEGYVAPAMAEFPVREGIENTNAAIKAVKVIRNGQVVIIRGEKVFNILGTEL